MMNDEFGEYDEDEMPLGFSCPLSVNRSETAIVNADNHIVAIYGIANETTARMQERRRAEFLVRLANREIVIDGGQVLKNTGEQWQDGRLVISFDPIEAEKSPVLEGLEASGNGQETPQKKIFDRKAYYKEWMRKRREKATAAKK